MREQKLAQPTLLVSPWRPEEHANGSDDEAMADIRLPSSVSTTQMASIPRAPAGVYTALEVQVLTIQKQTKQVSLVAHLYSESRELKLADVLSCDGT